MKAAILVLAMLVFLVPTVAYAQCGDGKIGKGEQCDPKAKVVGCRPGYMCTPTTCQCVRDYGSSGPETTKKKVKIKR
jgi:hypothetical protein